MEYFVAASPGNRRAGGENAGTISAVWPLSWCPVRARAFPESRRRAAHGTMPSHKQQRELFEGAVLPHFEFLYRFAQYLTRNQADAEDLTQDTLTLAFRKFEQFRAGTDAKPWLARIARNAFVDRLRRKGREPSVGTLEESLESLVDPESPEKHLEGALSGRKGTVIESQEVFFDLFGDEVNRHLWELPAEFRAAVVLSDVEGLNYREISEALDCPLGTVRSRISRAREHLRTKLYEYARSLGFVQESAK
jgi:RNA polymerase sigma-70 factor (ECF subfamily)